jgi:hypothetical protein
MADPVGSYDKGLSAKKAGTQTLMSYAAMGAALVTTLLASPELMAQVMAAVAKYPKAAAWVVGFFGVARFGLAFWKDYQKHKDAAWHMEHGVTATKAVELAVESGADPKAAKVDARVAEIKQEESK